MKNENEIDQLKQEVARLRREMDELKQFLQYHPPGIGDDDQPEAAYLSIRCAILQLAHPAHPNRAAAHMMGLREGGAFLAIMGKDEKTRLLLQVENDVPEINLSGVDGKSGFGMRLENGDPEMKLYGKNGNLGAMVKVVGEEERGQIGVSEAGKPRAIMQAMSSGGGGISVVHDDGHPRVAIASELNSGDLLMVTPDMKVAVKLSSNGLDGGFITVNRANGNPGLILSNIVTGGTVVVNDPHGQIIATLPSLDDLAE